ncbi:putative lccl domain containing protein [Diaporthe ampelina]|uniref:Putative lccl domain containing protein n=1 Tax=Diaporthe ampelina TaxID=1214573 RepID=A0A0G2FHK3_9PEZI|nr:putative lccl domain containing protein [Diaporthe ampelina]
MDLTPLTTEDKAFAKKDHHHLKPKPQKRLSRPQKIILGSILFVSWAVIFLSFSNSANPLLLEPSSSKHLSVRHFSCDEAFWPSAEKCGKGGVNCVPDTSGQFESKTMAFRCPAHCVRDAPQDGPPHLVGDREVTRRPVVIGGPIYRGDSAFCAAAVHDGVLDDAKGGCGVVKRMGQTNSFPGSEMFGVESLAVKTYFPLTFNFPTTNEEIRGECPVGTDRSWALPWVTSGETVLFFQLTSSTGARAAWLASVATAHLLRWRSSPAPSAEPVPAQKVISEPVPIPNMLEPEINGQTLDNSVSNITFKWATPAPAGVEGISMLVDDVERERVYFGDDQAKDSFFWERGPQAFVDYIRFGYVKNGEVLKYSPAGTWLLNDSWTGIAAKTTVKT